MLLQSNNPVSLDRPARMAPRQTSRLEIDEASQVGRTKVLRETVQHLDGQMGLCPPLSVTAQQDTKNPSGCHILFVQDDCRVKAAPWDQSGGSWLPLTVKSTVLG